MSKPETGSAESEITLQAIREIIVQEIGKVQTEIKSFKEDVCKTLDALEQTFDSKLTTIAQKIDIFEAGQK